MTKETQEHDADLNSAETGQQSDLAEHRQDLLDAFSNYQEKYEETKNPIYSWIVIEMWCHAKYKLHPDIDLPRWCLIHLAKSSNALNTLAFGKDFAFLVGEDPGAKKRLVEIKKIPQLIPQALGLCRRGWSAFRDFRAGIEKQHQMHAYYELRDQGLPPVEVMEQMRRLTGLTDERHIRRRIAEGTSKDIEGETSG